ENVPSRGRTVTAALFERGADATHRTPLVRASLYLAASDQGERLPAAVHRLRDAGPAEGIVGVFREPAAGVQEAGRGIAARPGSRDSQATRFARAIRGQGVPPPAENGGTAGI